MTAQNSDTPVLVPAVKVGPSRLTPDELDAALHTFEFEVRPGRTIEMRRIDMMTELMVGNLDTAMINATVDLSNAVEQASRDSNQVTSFEAIARMPQDQRDRVLLMLRRYAVSAIVDPQMTLDEQSSNGRVSVRAFTVPELLLIFNATPPAHVAPTAPINPIAMSPEQVQSFRPQPAPAITPAAPDGEDVRPESIELADSGVVEYAQG